MSPSELWHVLEVHPVDGADQRRGEQDGGPRRDLLDLFVLGVGRLGEVLHLLVLLLGDDGGVDGEHVAQQLPELVDSFTDLREMVLDVAQVPLELFVDAVLVEPGAEGGEDV